MLQASRATAAAPPRGFGSRFLTIFLLGLVGVASLPIIIAPLLRSRPLPVGAPDLPLWSLVALSLISPILFLTASAAVGAALAHRVGLVSRLVERTGGGEAIWPRLSAELPLALVLGLAVAGVVAALDTAFLSSFGAAWSDLPAGVQRPGSLAALAAGILYGGITEEIMLRWGLLSLLAWAGWRTVQRGRGSPHPALMWSAIGVTALVFGAGHLPAVASIVPLTPALVARTIALNAIGGVAFGWLFWRRSLEAAMLAHAAAHLGFALLAWSGVVG